MTFNAGQGPIDVPRLIELVERERVDLICLQEQEEHPDPSLGAYFRGPWRMDSTSG